MASEAGRIAKIELENVNVKSKKRQLEIGVNTPSLHDMASSRSCGRTKQTTQRKVRRYKRQLLLCAVRLNEITGPMSLKHVYRRPAASAVQWRPAEEALNFADAPAPNYLAHNSRDTSTDMSKCYESPTHSKSSPTDTSYIYTILQITEYGV